MHAILQASVVMNFLLLSVLHPLPNSAAIEHTSISSGTSVNNVIVIKTWNYYKNNSVFWNQNGTNMESNMESNIGSKMGSKMGSKFV